MARYSALGLTFGKVDIPVWTRAHRAQTVENSDLPMKIYLPKMRVDNYLRFIVSY